MTLEPGLQNRLLESDAGVRSLLIPLDGSALLVPNALVSEVAALTEIIPKPDGIDWLLGSVVWRGLRIPLISFERVIGETAAAPGRQSRAIVFNTLNGNRQLPFFAVLSQRIPSLLLVTARMLRRPGGMRTQDGVIDLLELQGDEVLVPDIDRLEQLVLLQGIKVERIAGAGSG